MTDAHIIGALTHLATCVGQRVPPERMTAYVERLRSLKNEACFDKAIIRLTETETMFPSLAAILAAYRDVMDAESRILVSADETPAWADFADLYDNCVGPCDRKFRLGQLMRNNGFCEECRPEAEARVAGRHHLAVMMRDHMEDRFGGGIGPATDPAGRCDDCHKQVEERWALGPGFFCRHCCTSRSKVKAKLDITGLLREMPGVEA